MRFLSAILAFAVFVALAGAAAFAVRLLDEWDLRHSFRSLAREAARQESLDREAALSLRRVTEKGRVSREVIAGRLTLAQAASCFEDLDAENALAQRREAVCASVMAWVREVLAAAPKQKAADVLSRLESEYRAYFGHAPPTASW